MNVQFNAFQKIKGALYTMDFFSLCLKQSFSCFNFFMCVFLNLFTRQLAQNAVQFLKPLLSVLVFVNLEKFGFIEIPGT